MSRLITVPPPGLAVTHNDGLSSYRTEMVSLDVEQDAEGLRLVVTIGVVSAALILDVAAQTHLAALLSVAAENSDVNITRTEARA